LEKGIIGIIHVPNAKVVLHRVIIVNLNHYKTVVSLD